MKLFDLSGKVAVVTGGNGGIGLGMAEGMASCGATVVIAGRNADKAAIALDALRGHGGRAEFIAADVSKKAECVNLIGEAEARFGRVDILVNNAGIIFPKLPQDYSEEDWHQIMDANLTGAFFCSQAAYHAMVKVGGGKMINVGSLASIFGAARSTPYGASKGGIVQMTKALASSWAKDNIQVNAVLPGWIETDMIQAARGRNSALDEKVLGRTPAARWGVPRDFAGIAAFLASSESDFISGTAIPVDGAYSVAL